MAPTIYCDSNDYEIGFDENSKVVWEVIDADEDEIEQLMSLSELDENEFDYEEEDRISYEINTISEFADEEYFLISYNHYENDKDKGSKAERIAMDPGDFAEDWEDLALDDYSLKFILTDTEDYVDEFEDDVSDTYKNIIYSSGSSIILNGTVGSFLFWLKIEYDEKGILEELTLVYNGQEIFNMIQKYYSKSSETPLLWVIILVLIIIVAVITGVVALIVVLTGKAKKKRPPKTPIPIKPTTEAEQLTKTQIATKAEPKKEPGKTQFCANCGTERDTDAMFCTYCGSKF